MHNLLFFFFSRCLVEQIWHHERNLLSGWINDELKLAVVELQIPKTSFSFDLKENLWQQHEERWVTVWYVRMGRIERPVCCPVGQRSPAHFCCQRPLCDSPTSHNTVCVMSSGQLVGPGDSRQEHRLSVFHQSRTDATAGEFNHQTPLTKHMVLPHRIRAGALVRTWICLFW